MAFAIVIATAIYALGRVSGAHLNPAVSIALWATKRFSSKDTGAYIVAQLIGAALGSLLFAACAGMDAVTIGGLGATIPFHGTTYGQAILAEFIGTFVLMLAIMGVAVDSKAPPGFAGLIIGLTVGGSHHHHRLHCRCLAQYCPDVWPLPRRLAPWRQKFLDVFSHLRDRPCSRGNRCSVRVRLPHQLNHFF